MNDTVPRPGPGEARPRNERHRLNDLLGMHVRFSNGRNGDQVIDVRLAPGDKVRGLMNELVVIGLVIGKQRPGTLLGYDRHPSQGPWVIRVIVRALHRHSGYVAWDEVDEVDWDNQVVSLRTNSLRDLS